MIDSFFSQEGNSDSFYLNFFNVFFKQMWVPVS